MDPIKRRAFLKGAAKTAAVVSAAGGGILLGGCSTGRDYDLVVSGGLVYDGMGGPPVRADVGISGGAVRAIGKIPVSRGRSVVEARGLAVAPGFIDVHEHTAVELLVNPRAESVVRQGVTTVVGGNCGESPFPLTAEMAEEAGRSMLLEYGLALDWRDARGFFERLGRSGLVPNYASFAGHGTIRASAMGYGNRPPSAAELERMKALVGEAMDAGALGLSSGLEYSPGSFAATDELVALCRVAARSGGVYATHIRNEQEGILEAVDEALRIAVETPVRLQISHLKIGYRKNWDKFDDLMSRIDGAAAGAAVRIDRYPYTAWGTGLNMFFPLWSREGTSRDFLARLKDPSLQPRLRAAVEKKGADVGSWDQVLISNVATERNRPYEGMNILEASARARLDPFEFMKRLLIEEDNEVGMITFAMSEDHLRKLLAHPLVGIGSDASAAAPYGPLAKGRPHPRVYGTFPRALGRYVREEHVVPLEEMIRKLTSMPAAHLGFLRRGALKAGWAADLVIFDPGRVADKATWTEPARYPEGIECVIVNGAVVLAGGEAAGRLPGKVLKRSRRGVVA